MANMTTEDRMQVFEANVREANERARQAREEARQDRERADQAREEARQDRERADQAREEARQDRERFEERLRQLEEENRRLRAEAETLQLEEENRRLRAEAQARQAEAQARQAEAQARQAEAQARQAEEQRLQAEHKAALASGEFYSTVADVWICGEECEEAKFSKESLDAVRRRDIHPCYKEAVKAARGPNPSPADTSSRSSGSMLQCSNSASNAERKKLLAERKKRLDNVRIDGTSGHAQIAHLIPHYSTCASFFGPLAEAAAGVDLDSDPESEKRRMVLVHGQKGDSKRITNTGIKHDVLNKARIHGQAFYFDSTPSLLLIPILTLEETLAYPSGTTNAQYEVLVACTDPTAYRHCDLIEDYEETCTQEDVETATTTLDSFVKAAAYTLTLAEERKIEALGSSKKKTIEETKKQLLENRTVKVPNMHSWKGDETRLPKLTFGMANPKLHHDCDPFLLFVRAAVVWSTIQNQMLLPPCPDPLDGEDSLEDGLSDCLCDAHGPDSITMKPVPSEIDIDIKSIVVDDEDDTVMDDDESEESF